MIKAMMICLTLVLLEGCGPHRQHWEMIRYDDAGHAWKINPRPAAPGQ